MIADCESGRIDFIVTKSISRFSRNTTDCLELVRKLLDLNIPIYFEKENLNTGSMESELFLSILSSIAQGESVSISENSKWSVQKRFLNGTYKISSPPYGFRWDGQRMEIVPEQAEIVKWIFAQVLSGKGTQAIADELNEVTFNKVQEKLHKRAAALGRLNRTAKNHQIEVHTKFYFPDIRQKYDNPKEQAEYLYSLIECEV